MRLFFGHAFSRVPPEIGEEMQRQILERSLPGKPGLAWWSDHALMVFEQDGALMVERAEVEAIIGKVTPLEWLPAGHA